MKKAIFFNMFRADISNDSLALLKDASFALIDISDGNNLAALNGIYDLENSWLLTDKLDEVEIGNRANCKTILIANGAENEWYVTPLRQPLFISANFENAAGAVILRNIYQMVQAYNQQLEK